MSRRQLGQALAVLSLLAACAPAPRYTSEPPGGRTVVEELRARQRALRNSSPRRLLEVADGYLGIPYKWGGTTRRGMDCSAMARAIVREAYGIELPRTSKQMFVVGSPIANRDDLRPGDLLFFRIAASGPGISHVGVYVGDDRFIHASLSRGGVIDSLNQPYFGSRYAGARRLTY